MQSVGNLLNTPLATMTKPFKKSYEPRRASSGRWLGYGWMKIPQWNIVICAPLKAGSSTVKDFLWKNNIDCEYAPRYKVEGLNNIYFVVRDPIQRFESLWRSKCRDRHNSHLKFPYHTWKTLRGATQEQLMDYIESNEHPDAHWTPQMKLVGDLDVTLIPLEALSWWWNQSGFGSLGKSNTTEGETEISDSLKKRVLTFYADDLKLYHKAQCDLCWDTIISPIVDV